MKKHHFEQLLAYICVGIVVLSVIADSIVMQVAFSILAVWHLIDARRFEKKYKQEIAARRESNEDFEQDWL